MNDTLPFLPCSPPLTSSLLSPPLLSSLSLLSPPILSLLSLPPLLSLLSLSLSLSSLSLSPLLSLSLLSLSLSPHLSLSLSGHRWHIRVRTRLRRTIRSLYWTGLISSTQRR